MKKVTACTKRSRIALSLSNFMPGCRDGYEAAKAEFKKVVSECETAEQACAALNNHRWTADRFTPYAVLENGFTLKAVDFCGNESLITVKSC